MSQPIRIHLVVALALCTSACGDKPAEPAAEAPALDQHSEHDHAAMPAAVEAPLLPTLAPNARVMFIEPVEGATITGPLENGTVAVSVKMGAENVAIKPAGALEAGSGHHHVLIDATVPSGQVVPKDDSHLHFGQGQTEATIRVAPGAHKLTLQLADGIHRSYGEAQAATINVTVAAAGSVEATAK
jgi:hypothetical protein